MAIDSSSAPLRCAVIGDGSMGTTLAHVIASGGHACALWCRTAEAADAINRDHAHPARPRHALDPRLRATASLEDAVAGVSLVLVAVHSTAFRETARALAPLLSPGVALVSSTKGVELRSLRLMSEVLAEEVPASAVGTIGGTNITPEIMAGQVSALVIASPSAEARAMAARALAAPHLVIETTADLRSVELVSLVKNVASIAVAIGAGAGMGYNAQGLVFARALAEIRTLGAALGIDPRVFDGVAGTGDIFLTASSPQSLNRALGIELGRGRRLDEIVPGLPEVPEGIGAVRATGQMARQAGLSLPLCAVAEQVLEGGTEPGALERALLEAWMEPAE